MKLGIAALGCILLALADAQSNCNVYFTQYNDLLAGDKASKTATDFKKHTAVTRLYGIDFDKVNRKLYYSKRDGDAEISISAIGADGTGEETILSISPSDCSYIGAIALDTANDRVLGYCPVRQNVGQYRGYLLVGSSDGSGATEWRPGFGRDVSIKAIAYDAETEKAYAMDRKQRRIMVLHVPRVRAFPDPVPMVLYDDAYPKPGGDVGGIDIDTSSGYVYWVSYPASVYRAPLDGSGPKERLYSREDFSRGIHDDGKTFRHNILDVKVDAVNQLLYIASRSSVFVARADGRGTPKVRWTSKHPVDVLNLALDCNGERVGRPLLAQCSSDDECFFQGVCTARVGKQKKCRFCARKNQICDSDDECCQSPSERYCHPIKKVCKRRPPPGEFGQCPTGTAFSSLSESGERMNLKHNHGTYAPYNPNYPYPDVEAVDLPFNFPWFGSLINRTYVTYYGVLSMEMIDSAKPIGPIERHGTVGGYIPRISLIGADIWNGPIYRKQSSTSITFSWEGAGWVFCMKGCSQSGTLNAQVTLYEDGRIVMCWGEVDGTYPWYGNAYYSLYAGLEDDSLGISRPAVMFPDNPFSGLGEVNSGEGFDQLSGGCACFG